MFAVGIASLTDRVLPHLFPSTDVDVFEATIERSMAIERPPPRSSLLDRRDEARRARERCAGCTTSPDLESASRRSCSRTARAIPSRMPGWAACFGATLRSTRLRPVLGRGREGVLARRSQSHSTSDPSARSILDGSRRRRGAPSTRRTRWAPRRARRRRFSAAGRRSSRGRKRERGARAVPRARRVLPARAPALAPRPLSRSRYSSGNQSRRLRGSRSRPCTRLRGSRARERGLGLGPPARPALPRRRLGPALLARPRAPEPAERERGAIDVAPVLAVPVDADRPIEQRSRLVGECARILGGHEIRCCHALFRLPLEFASQPPNRIGTASSQKYDPALDHGDGGIWIDVRLACRPTRQLARRRAPRLGEVR